MVQVLAPFVPLFSERVFQHVWLLVVGAILAPGKRTVASALRAVGLEIEQRFCRYHRVLSRGVWSSREASHVLLGLLLWKPLCPKEDRWCWAWMRLWNGAEARRSRRRASTAT
jgi:hypothetical protein